MTAPWTDGCCGKFRKKDEVYASLDEDGIFGKTYNIYCKQGFGCKKEADE